MGNCAGTCEINIAPSGAGPGLPCISECINAADGAGVECLRCLEKLEEQCRIAHYPAGACCHCVMYVVGASCSVC